MNTSANRFVVCQCILKYQIIAKFDGGGGEFTFYYLLFGM